jgi:DNA-binding MarR family transcriptional regulator
MEEMMIVTPVGQPEKRQPEVCNCLALRQAARHVTQFYDRNLADTGLRTTQYSILAKLSRVGPLTIGALAEAMVMDRTTLGRNIRPLERDGLIAIAPGSKDKRSRELSLTEAGSRRMAQARDAWARSQERFEAFFGQGRTLDLRALMRALTQSDFDAAGPSRG